MATLTIRNLDEDLRAQLRVRAARHGRSMEAEVRAILRDALAKPQVGSGMGTRIHQRFATIGGIDLQLPERVERPRAGEPPE